jgi:hypothetical protein
MLCVFALFGVVTCVLFSRTVEHGRRLTVAHIVILVLGYVITHYGAYFMSRLFTQFFHALRCACNRYYCSVTPHHLILV